MIEKTTRRWWWAIKVDDKGRSGRLIPVFPLFNRTRHERERERETIESVYESVPLCWLLQSWLLHLLASATVLRLCAAVPASRLVLVCVNWRLVAVFPSAIQPPLQLRERHRERERETENWRRRRRRYRHQRTAAAAALILFSGLFLCIFRESCVSFTSCHLYCCWCCCCWFVVHDKRYRECCKWSAGHLRTADGTATARRSMRTTWTSSNNKPSQPLQPTH